MEQIFLPLHLLSLAFCFVTIIRSDWMGSSWMRGKVNTIDPVKLGSLHKQAWVGLLLMIVTGAVLFSQNTDTLLASGPFYVKMTCVLALALVINAFVIGRFMKIATQKKFSEVNGGDKAKLFLSGFVSIFGWVTAFLAAFYILPDGEDAVLPIVDNQSTTKVFTMSDMATHNNDTSCYTAINGNVYDITKYLSIHPGGKSAIMRICGNDGTEVFTRKHGGDERPNLILRSMQVGVISK